MALPSGSDEAYYENIEKQSENIKGKKKKCSNQSTGKSQERLDFKLSDFHATQVPKGWNKLFICITCVESGKTISKMGKASVQNGECHWKDSIVNSIWISVDNDDLNDQGSLIKLVVAMGSTRFGTLGEATVDLANYIRSETSIASLPLTHCYHGTILQVKIQCLSPRRKIRDEYLDEENSYVEEMNVDYDDLDNKSDASDSTFSKNVGPSYCNQLHNTCHPGEFSSNETSLLASGSHYYLDSLEGSSSFGKQHANHSKNGPYLFYDASISICSFSSSAATNLGMQLQDQMEDFRQRVSHRRGTTLTRSLGSSKDLLDAAEVTIKLLNAEAKMWEKNATKLSIDVERLQKDLCSHSKNEKELEMELSALQKECYGLKAEIEQLKTMLEESSMAKQKDSENSKFQTEEMRKIIKELKDDIEYHKGLNNDLELQLKKTQESNIDLASILQELEETIEKQKMEIIDLSMTKFQDTTNYSPGHEDSEEDEFHLKRPVLLEKMRTDCSDSELDLSSSEFPIKCLHEGIELKEFWSLELQEKQKNMESTIKFLERSLVEKDQEMLKERGFMAQTSEENNAKWNHKLSEKEQEIITIQKKLYEGIDAFDREIIALKQNMQELEAKICENLSEICKLEEELSMSGLTKEVSAVYLLTQSIDVGNKHFLELEFQVQGWKEFCSYLEGELDRTSANLKMKELANAALEEKLQCCTKFNMFDADSAIKISKVFLGLYKQLQLFVANLSTSDLTSELSEAAGSILTTILQLRKFIQTQATTDDDEFQFHGVQDGGLQENMHCISSQEPRNQPIELVFETLVNEDGLRNLSKLGSAYNELDFLSALEAENVQLSERIFGLEAILRHLTDEKDSTSSMLEDSEILAINLQVEIRRLETKIEAQKVNMKRKEEDMKKQWIQAQEECNFLKVANLKLQATNENLIEASKILEKENGELRIQNLELHKQCTMLESELKESQNLFSDVSKQVEDLQYKFTSMLEDIYLREKTINSDLDELLQESKKYKERLNLEESLLTQMYLEKTVEVGNLQREVSHLRDQISSAFDRKERTGSDIVLELYALCADKVLLEAALQDLKEKVKLYETKLNTLQAEYEANVQRLTEELAATTENKEILMVNYKKAVLLLESVRSNEEKLKRIVRGLEVELKASEFERLQIKEDYSNCKVQLRRTETLQDEVLALKKSLSEAKFEYSRLETSYQMLSAQYEELKAEKIAHAQRSSTTEEVTSELKDYKRCKVNLEEKVLRLEWDLIVREASCHNNAQLRCELVRMRIANGELQWKIHYLQEEKEECLKKVKALDEELNQKKDELKLLQKEDNCGNIESSEGQSVGTDILPNPSDGRDKLQTDKYPILVDLKDSDSGAFFKSQDTISCQRSLFLRANVPTKSGMCNSPAPEVIAMKQRKERRQFECCFDVKKWLYIS